MTETAKDETKVLGYVVLSVHVRYNRDGPAAQVVILYCVVGGFRRSVCTCSKDLRPPSLPSRVKSSKIAVLTSCREVKHIKIIH